MVLAALFILGCGGDEEPYEPITTVPDTSDTAVPTSDGTDSTDSRAERIVLDPARRHLAIRVEELPRRGNIIVEPPADPEATVVFRLESPTGELIEPELTMPYKPEADTRLEVDVTSGGVTEQWSLSFIPEDLPVMTGEGGELDGYFMMTLRDFTLDPQPSGYGGYLLIFDGYGVPVWWRPISGPSFDFRVGGDGTFTTTARLDGMGLAHTRLDPLTGDPIEQWRVEDWPEGWLTLEADPHELLVREDGTAMVVVTGVGRMDLTAVGGSANGEVQHSAIVELDRDRKATAIWEAWVEDIAQLPPDAIATEAWRNAWWFTHINSIDDLGDAWLVSLRTPCEVVKIDKASGEVLWRLGGAFSSFEITNDIGSYGQHSARWVEPNRVILFDNRTDFGSEPTGDVRFAEFELDMDAMTASLVNSYELEGAGGADYTGSVQRLADGRTIIGWGTTQAMGDGSRAPSVTVLEADGTPSLELSLPWRLYSYRAWFVHGDPIEGTWSQAPR